MAIQHSVDFIKTQSKRVGQLFSREHRQLAKEFVRFRDKALYKMDTMDEYYIRLLGAEIRLAERNPVLDAEYKIRDDP